jgi:hypothetical protein
MNPSAIYSKSGKGVQEAAGKTSHLARPDRAVLAAIDGRATLAEVAQKVGKTFDAAFEKLVGELDKGGFVREVSAGTPAAAKPGAAAPKPAAKSADPASDLDFTSVLQVRPGKATPPPQAPPRPAAPPPKPSVNIPPAPPPPSAAEKAKAEQAAKAQQDAFTKAREDAERKQQAERDRVKAETEAKLRAETEAKMRAQAKEDADRKFAEQLAAKMEAEKKAVAEAAEAKIRAERDAAAKAAAEAKAKADAEAKKVREEAERVRREAEEKAEKARREQEELRRKLEEERKAREEAERKAKEEARRLEEERRKLEEERKQREAEKRREEEERVARRKREAEEEEKARAERAERRKREEEQEARARAERKKREEEDEAREQAEREARRTAQAKEEEKAKEVEFSLPDLNVPPVPKAPEPVKAAPPPPPAPAGGGGFSDSLLADLDSFSTRDEQEQKEREEQLLKEKEAAAQRAREAEERRQHELIEQMQRDEKERRKQEERERKAKDEAELKEREEKEKQRLKEEEDKRAQEAEERAKKAKQEESLTASAQRGAQFDLEQRKKREAALQARVPVRAKGEARAAKGGWGKPVAITLFLLLVIAVGVAHVMPIDTSDYERGATEALGQPVRIGSANLSLIGGLQLKFQNVTFGDTKIAELRGFPEFDSLLGPKKVFSRIEIDGARVPQEVLGPALFTKVRSDNFSVARVVAKNLELAGPLAMPKGLELDAAYNADGMVRTAFLRGPEALVVKLEPKGSSIEVDMSAATFTLPFAPGVSFGRFSARGSMNSSGFNISEWDAVALNGVLSGTASIIWGETWTVEGVVTARNINAAVFAPALVSDGRGEGSGKFSMRGPQPAKLGESARIDGTFTVTRGVLGSFDLARAVQSQGKAATGRTEFSEMTGNGVYDRGAVALRNVTIGAGQLNAGASADIAQNGALSGRIVADVRVASQQIRATLNLGGTVKEPQVRN